MASGSVTELARPGSHLLVPREQRLPFSPHDRLGLGIVWLADPVRSSQCAGTDRHERFSPPPGHVVLMAWVAADQQGDPAAGVVHHDRRWVTLLVGRDPRHQHDVAWGWAEALMTIRSGTLRRSDRSASHTLYRPSRP